MLKQHESILNAIEVVQSFANEKKLKVDIRDADNSNGPHVSLRDAADKAVISFRVRQTLGLSFAGLKHKIELSEAVMFEYTGYGTFDVGTRRGKAKLTGLLDKKLAEHRSAVQMTRALNLRP